MQDTSVALTKLDLEGGEMLALRGAGALLKTGQLEVILLEAFDHQLEPFGSSRRDVVDLLRDCHYTIFEYDADTNALQACDPSAPNFVAVHRSALAKVEQRLTPA